MTIVSSILGMARWYIIGIDRYDIMMRRIGYVQERSYIGSRRIWSVQEKENACVRVRVLVCVHVRSIIYIAHFAGSMPSRCSAVP